MVTKSSKKKSTSTTKSRTSATKSSKTKVTNVKKAVVKAKSVGSKKKATPKKAVTKPATTKVRKQSLIKTKASVKKVPNKEVTKATAAVKPAAITNKATSTTKTSTTVNNPTTAVKPNFMAYRFEPYVESSGEQYMNDRMLAHFRKILEAWRKELMEHVDNTLHGMKEATVLADLNDRATQEEEFNFELRTRDRERKLLKKIEEAIQQIDEKDYGYCASCGIEIGARRLEARPTAQMCIDCKTLDEIREKRVAS